MFVSYSHYDAAWLARLSIHLKPLEKDHDIEIWDDTKIKPGSRWQKEIQIAIASAKVAVLLVSADFLASDFIATDELPPLLSAAEKEGAIILPIIISPSRFEKNTSLSQFQAINNPSKPLITLSIGEQEAILVRAAEAIEYALHDSLNLQIDSSKDSMRLLYRPRPKINDLDATADEGKPGEKYLKSSARIHPAILVAIIGGIATLITAYWQFLYKPPDPTASFDYTARIINAETKMAIQGAKVSVDVEGAPLIYHTDSDGILYLKLAQSSKPVHIRIEVKGYQGFDRSISSSRTGIEEIHLMPVSPPVVGPPPAINKNKSVPSPVSKPPSEQRSLSEKDLEKLREKAYKDLDYRSPQSNGNRRP